MVLSQSPAGTDERTTLLSLTGVLELLGVRLRDQVGTIRRFSGLSDRAKAIAAGARELQTSRWGYADKAAALGADVDAFVADVLVAANRAAAEADGTLTLIKALSSQADHLRALCEAGPDHAEPDGARQVLGQVKDTLQTLNARALQADGASRDAARLAEMARALTSCTTGLGGSAREADHAVTNLNRLLMDFAIAAEAIVERLSRLGLIDSTKDLCATLQQQGQRAGAAPRLAQNGQTIGWDALSRR